MKKRILSAALALLAALWLLPFAALAAGGAAAPFEPAIQNIMRNALDSANGLFVDVDGDGVPELLAAYQTDSNVRGAVLIALKDGRPQYLVNTDSVTLSRDIDFFGEDYSSINVVRLGNDVQIMAVRQRYYPDVVDEEFGQLYWEMGEFWLFDYAAGSVRQTDHWSYRFHEVAGGRYFNGETEVKHNGMPSTDEALFEVMDRIAALSTVSLYEDSDGVPLSLLVRAAEGSFIDVDEREYYAASVAWAVGQGVTNGTSFMTFSPDDPCTRGQIVTFLWRAAGSPEPQSGVNPFADVKASDYFYKAVLWAVEQGITNGVDPTHFGPGTACTRAHVVTFLWRSHGRPAPGEGKPFRDVPAGQYFTDAVLWAVSKKITNGVDAAHFAPGSTCTRGQIVTFLYRDLAK